MLGFWEEHIYYSFLLEHTFPGVLSIIMKSVRQRNIHKPSDAKESQNETESPVASAKPNQDQGDKQSDKEPRSKMADEPRGKLLRGSYWLTRIVFIRSLGVIYCKI